MVSAYGRRAYITDFGCHRRAYRPSDWTIALRHQVKPVKIGHDRGGMLKPILSATDFSELGACSIPNSTTSRSQSRRTSIQKCLSFRFRYNQRQKRTQELLLLVSLALR